MSARNDATPGIGWNANAGRYVSLRSGQFVSTQTVQNALQATIDASRERMAVATQSLRAGQTNVAQWQTAMMSEIKTTHLTSAALAKGGWAQMTPASYGRVGQAVRVQYGYLAAFAEQIADGTQKLDGTLGRRAAMYGNAGRQTFEATTRADQRLRGVREHRSVRHATDSCSECVDLESLGWVSVDTTIALPGARICRSNCRCQMSYR